MQEIKKNLAPKEFLIKIQRWCAYQERSQQETRNKLYELGLFAEEAENCIVDLIATNFLNEERFAVTFARGKFRIKKWGKIKIKSELRKKRVSEFCIKKALNEINPDEYYKTLQQLAETKYQTIKVKHSTKSKYKLMYFLIGKGFEPDLVREMVEQF